jgi:hypothetical protein
MQKLAKKLLDQFARADLLFEIYDMQEANELELNFSGCDMTKGPLLVRTLVVEYALMAFRGAIGVGGVREGDWAELVQFVAKEMESHPMFGSRALVYWDDLKLVGETVYGSGIEEAPSKQALARLYGFWFLKNVGYANLDLDAKESLIVGSRIHGNLRKLFKVD